MKTFKDSAGTDWTVFEVRRQGRTRQDSGGDLSHLPSSYAEGWLCFESSSAKRRLTHFPERWREFGDTELEKLLGEAQPAPRSSLRLGDDLSENYA